MTTRLLFLCLARDCAKTLPMFYRHLDSLTRHGFRCYAIVGENGSRDKTRAAIHQTARFHLLDTSAMADGTSRLQRMAIGRQMLLEKARTMEPADYIVVCDLDEVMLDPPKPEVIARAIERLQDPNLFAVGATSYPCYYDLLALRLGGIDYSVVLHMETELAKRNPFTYYQFQKRRLYDNRKQMTSSKPILCASTFNGYCIYKAAPYLGGTYRSNNEHVVCEHVTMNTWLGDLTGGQMVIAPELSVLTPHEHMPVGFVRFWWDRIRKVISL
jgi:hypothetical protein